MKPLRLPAEREHIVRTCLDLLGTGLIRGTSGNVSIRDAVTGLIAVTPTGLAYPSMTAADVPLVMPDGQIVDGDLAPTSELRLHLDVYRARPDVHAIVHTHSPFATTWSALGEPVPAVHYLLARAGRQVAVTDYHRYGSAELAAACVEGLGDDFGVLLGNHGVVAVGAGLAAAVSVAEAIEFTAEIAWRARAIGQPRVLDPDEMAAVALAFNHYGQPVRGAENPGTGL